MHFLYDPYNRTTLTLGRASKKAKKNTYDLKNTGLFLQTLFFLYPSAEGICPADIGFDQVSKKAKNGL